MVRNITIFATIFLIFALVFSFVSLKVVRTYDLSNVAKNGFVRTPEKTLRDEVIERIDNTIGYTSDSDMSNPFVVSAILGTYPKDEEITSEVVPVPGKPQVAEAEVIRIVPDLPPQPIEEITPLPIVIAPINDTLTAEVIIEKEPEIKDNTPRVRDTLSQEKAEARLVDMLSDIATKSDPKQPTIAMDIDPTVVYMNSNDMLIARDALREAALRSIYSIVRSDISNEFVWKDSMENN